MAPEMFEADLSYLRHLASLQDDSATTLHRAGSAVPEGWGQLDTHGRICQPTREVTNRLETTRSELAQALTAAAQGLSASLIAASGIYEDTDQDEARSLEHQIRHVEDSTHPGISSVP
jgi:hypothetical protein